MSTRSFCLAQAALALMATPVLAQSTTSEEDDLAAALAADAAAAEETQPPPPPATATTGSLAPDLAFVLDLAAAWFSEADPLQGGGHDPTEDGFTLQQLEMSFGKSVDPYLRFDGSVVFFPDEVEIEEAYATTLALPHSLQARAGQFLTRFGRHNPTHLHAWDFVDQPFSVTRVFGGEGNRGRGVELSWLTPLPWYGELVVSVTDHDQPLESLIDLQTTVALRQFFELSPDWSLATGLSAAGAGNDLGEHTRSYVAGVDLYLKWRPITAASYQSVALTAEWFARRRQLPGERLDDATGYAQVSWRFARRWASAVRFEHGNDDGDGARQRTAANLTFSPTEFSRLRTQGSYDRPDGRDGIWALFVAIEVSVGAHGAHAF